MGKLGISPSRARTRTPSKGPGTAPAAAASPLTFTALTPAPAPVDRDHGPRHVVRQVGRQKFDNLRAILDRPETPQRDQLGSISIALNTAGDDRRHDPAGRDHTWGDAVGGDPAGAKPSRVVGDRPSPGDGPIRSFRSLALWVSFRCPEANRRVDGNSSRVFGKAE